MFGNLLGLRTPGLKSLGSRFIPLVCDSPGDGHRGGNARHPSKPVCPQLLLSFGQGLDHRFSLLSPLHGVPPKLLHPMFSSTRPMHPPDGYPAETVRFPHGPAPPSHPPDIPPGPAGSLTHCSCGATGAPTDPFSRRPAKT